MSIRVRIDETYTDYKHPISILDYELDWSEWLNGDTIINSAWEVSTGLTVEQTPAPSNTTTSTRAFISGGADKQKYTVTNTITTQAGRKESKSFVLFVTAKGGK